MSSLKILARWRGRTGGIRSKESGMRIGKDEEAYPCKMEYAELRHLTTSGPSVSMMGAADLSRLWLLLTSMLSAYILLDPFLDVIWFSIPGDIEIRHTLYRVFEYRPSCGRPIWQHSLWYDTMD